MNELLLISVITLTLTILVLYILDRKKLERIEELEQNIFFKDLELDDKNNSIAVYKSWNVRYRKVIKEMKETVQKDCTKNTNLTNKTDEKTTSNRKKNTGNEKTARKNEKRKNKS